MCAAENGHVDCARLLLDAGADKDAKTNVRGVFVFLISSYHGGCHVGDFVSLICPFNQLFVFILNIFPTYNYVARKI